MKKLLYFFSFAIVSTIFWALPTPTLAVCECTAPTFSPGGFTFQNTTVQVPMPESYCRQRTDCTWITNTPSPATPAPNSSNNTQITDDGTIIVDARCHTQTQCITSRQSIGIRGDALSEGFVSTAESEAACAPLAESSGEDVGFCLAGSDATTNVTFFGRREFRSIGDFISYIYSISTGVAATLAVIVLIVSGIQIMTAGGNTSTVSSAKKRIGGAVAGLVLLGTAYVILRAINPALVELRQPSVYMINQQIINPIEASEEQLCDPDGTGPYGGCAADEYCAPVPGFQIEDSLDGACEQAAVFVIILPALVAAGVIAAPSVVSAGGILAEKTAATFISYIPTINGVRGTAVSLLKIGGRLFNTAWIAAKITAVTGGLIAVDALTGTSDAAIAWFDSMAGVSSFGICQPRGSGLRAGDFCSTDPNAGITCADNMPCVPDARLNNALSCWGPSNSGFCSSGRNGAICEDDSHCKTAEGYTCFEKDWGGSIGKRKSCSNGGEGAYCNTNAVNASGQGDCATGLSCVDNLCTAFAAESDFDLCQTTDNCQNIRGGGAYRCFKVTNDCRLSSGTQNDFGATMGVCLRSTNNNLLTQEKNRLNFDTDRVYVTRDGIRYNYGPNSNTMSVGQGSLFREVVTILDRGNVNMEFSEMGPAYCGPAEAWLRTLGPNVTVTN